jgi:hypothetical protein
MISFADSIELNNVEWKMGNLLKKGALGME